MTTTTATNANFDTNSDTPDTQRVLLETIADTMSTITRQLEAFAQRTHPAKTQDDTEPTNNNGDSSQRRAERELRPGRVAVVAGPLLHRNDKIRGTVKRKTLWTTSNEPGVDSLNMQVHLDVPGAGGTVELRAKGEAAREIYNRLQVGNVVVAAGPLDHRPRHLIVGPIATMEPVTDIVVV